VTEKIDPLRWETFGPEAKPELEKHTANAMRDVWWTWPEAIVWLGSPDYRNIATLRQWGDWWQDAEGNQLAGQADLAKNFCTFPQQVEESLIQAIETGIIKSSGCSNPEAKPELLEPVIWRGGAIIFSHGTACLVSKLNISSAPWAYNIEVNRVDLVTLRATRQADAATDVATRSTANGEHECKDWLLSAFAQDTEMKRSRDSFRDEAIGRFSGRLSVRGFNRVWDAVAPESGRSKPGRKGRKS